MPSLAQRIGASNLDDKTKREILDLLLAARLDIVACHTRITGIAAKLDADGGVTDTNYGALWPAPTGNLTA